MVSVAQIFFSALFLTGAFPGFSLHYIAWIALVPLFLLIRRSGPRTAFLLSWITGALFYSGLLWPSLTVRGINLVRFFVLNGATAWHFGTFGLSACYLQKKSPRWNVLTFPAVWCVLEYARSHIGFLSVPWGILGYSQYSVLPVAGIAAFTGVYGVSFLIVTVNAVLAEIIAGRRETLSRETIKSFAVSFGGIALLLLAAFASGTAPAGRHHYPILNAALIQGNVRLPEEFDAKAIEKVFRKYRELTLDAAVSRPALVAWPESSVPGRIPYDSRLVAMLSGVARETGAYVLLGTSKYDKFGADQRTNRSSNSAFLFSPQGNILGRYDKIRLLPFDEYVPLRGSVKWPSWIVSSDSVDYEPGRAETIFEMGDIRFGAQVCWENSFPDLFRRIAGRGVSFMASMSNESFVESPFAHHNFLAMNAFRAIENHVSIVRVATTGVSCIIGPDGGIVERVKDRELHDVNVEGFLTGQIPLTTERSFYNRYGDWFIGLLVIMLIGFALREIKQGANTASAIPLP